ncbi:MAG: CBS domain-containing protein [Thermoprotei archaeon]|nr:CBS domain-containing protein [Thermoprotei archaeon]
MPPKVMDYMSSPVIVISPSDTLSYARNLMLRNKISSLIVVEGEEPIGVVTTTDFIRTMSRADLARRPWNEIVVREIMSEKPITIRMTSSIIDAARIMLKNQISTLPVLDNGGKLVGIIKRTDLVRGYAENYRDEHKVEELMDEEPPKVTPFSPITAVIDKIGEKPYFKVLVVDGERLVGVIAKRDLVFVNPAIFSMEMKYIKKDELLEKGRTGGVRYYLVPLALDIMTANPKTSYPEEDAADAAKLMSDEKIGCLPVLRHDGDKPVGIITKHEITLALSKM